MKYKKVVTEYIEPVPENLYDAMLLANNRGISFNNIRVWNKGVEMIPCEETKTGRIGYYDTVEKKFTTVEDILKGFGPDAKISIK